jgi:5-methylcytosine-specific restriction endonuclease McrA
VAHGTATTYGRGCRCRPCTDAASSNAVRNRSRRFREAGMSDDTGHRKRCRKYGGSYEFVRRDDIYERDSWNCGICGEPVDQEAVWPHPLSPSLDHIVPLALGGDHSYANTQCSHLRCNQAKQHRIGQASTL